MLTVTEIQTAIINAATDTNLQKQENDEPISTVARNISNVLGYNSDMPDLEEATIKRALRRNGVKITFLSIIDAIRNQYIEDQRQKRKNEMSLKNKESNEAANWNFFIQCWNSFKKYGDIKRIKPLTIKFLSSWLRLNPKMIDKNELETCRKWIGKTDSTSSFDETVVIYVMNKLKKTEESNPQKVEEFINRKKESIRIYYKEKYGSEPVWE